MPLMAVVMPILPGKTFSTWFREGAMAAHGNLELPTDRPLSELVADSERAPVPAG